MENNFYSHVHCKFLQVRNACAFITPKANEGQGGILQRCTDVHISEGDVWESGKTAGVVSYKIIK